MWSRLRSHRPSHALVVAYLALFFAVGGGTAVALSGQNTVFSDDITNNEVRTRDVRNDNLSGGGLTSADVRPDALTGSDVRESSLGQVPSAANAANADTLDGHDAACPAGTFENRSLCFDSDPKPANNFKTSINVCNNDGGDMPTHSQLRGIRDAVDLGSGATAHWVDELHEDDDGTGLNSIALADNGATTPLDELSQQPYRCVFPLLR